MKKKILTVALVVALLCTCFAGTYAYLTDTHAVKNTFTTGNVYITLDEAAVKQDVASGNWVVDDTKDRVTAVNDKVAGNAYHLLPNTTVVKDPTITLNSGSENAWIAAKVKISGAADLYSLIGIPGTDMIDINGVVSGGLLGDGTKQPEAKNWNGLNGHELNGAFIYQVPDKANNTWTLYIFMLKASTENQKVVLFNQLNISADWDNAEMEKINGMVINVEAFATQEAGFDDCYQAMTEAFGDKFNFS